MTQPQSRRVIDDSFIRWSVIACFVGVGGFLLWSAFAKLDEGVTASGQVVVQDNRKAIQHFEGGIISSMNVREGQTVNAGDVLLELQPVQSESARDELAQEYAVQAATLDRLMALRSNRPTIVFQSASSVTVSDEIKNDIILRQRALFEQQLNARQAELDVLETRRTSVIGRQRDLDSQVSATRRQLAAGRQDLSLRRELLAEKLETIGNVAQLEREVAGYESALSRLIGEKNEAVKAEEEVDNQILEAKARFSEQISEQIVEAQTRSFAARERLLALDDRLSRTTIRAPETGTILNLAHSTVGGVVGAGETIMEIVPTTGDLIVNVRISPTDRDAVSPGQEVKAQFSAYKSFRTDPVIGEVINVSADLKQDQASGAFFYEAKLTLDSSTIDPNDRIMIIPGMPVDAFIASGTSRTFLDYVFEPIRSTWQRGTRMS